MPDAPISSAAPVQSPAPIFSPVGELISKSWEMVKMVWKNLIILSIVIWIATFLITIVGGGAIFGSFAISGGFEHFNAGAIGASIGIGVLMVVAIVVLSSVLGTGMMIAVTEAKLKPSIGSLISRGLKLFVPVFFTSLLVLFLVYGGILLFIIPGIVIAILTSLATYEVVFTENRYMAAIKNSVKIVSQNFGELFIRVLVLIGLVIGLVIIEAILQGIVGEESPASGIISLAGGILQMIFGWFALCYYYITYQEARNNTNFEKPASTLWMWIVAALGWVVGVLVIFVASAAIAAYISNYAGKGGMQDYGDPAPMMLDGSGEVNTDQLLEQYGQDMSEEEKQMFKQMMENTESAVQEDQKAAEMETQQPI